jgi:hypothetical protein
VGSLKLYVEPGSLARQLFLVLAKTMRGDRAPGFVAAASLFRRAFSVVGALLAAPLATTIARRFFVECGSLLPLFCRQACLPATVTLLLG